VSVFERVWRAGRAGWSWVSIATAILVIVPVGMLASSVLRPRGDVWSQQWSTRLPGELWSTAVLLVGVAVASTVIGAGLAWLTAAYRFPGSRQLGWMLILPLAIPSYILGFLTLSTVGILLYITAMCVSGIMQGLMWRAYDKLGFLQYSFIETVEAMKPYYMIRAVGGLLFVLGSLIMAYNVWRTIRGDEAVDLADQPRVAAAPGVRLTPAE